jgi:hypothetical protein
MTRLRYSRGERTLAHDNGFEFVSNFMLLANERR